MGVSRTLPVSGMVAVVLTMAVLMQNGVTVEARSLDGLSRLLTALSGPSTSSDNALTPISPALSFMPEHPMEKRQAFDRNCKGVYDRGIFQKLEQVCDDCYNLYRKPYVAVSCKSNCYANDVFRQCLTELLLEDVLGEYARAVQSVGK
uniref:Prepro-crustacean hyperglycemic hormone n=1 Tax=Galathea strigosa TaxID=453336 RepID=B2BF49_9EUCA|nr:prepro-crustacean hyperglycemic hormone [Galathea strigosa]